MWVAIFPQVFTADPAGVTGAHRCERPCLLGEPAPVRGEACNFPSEDLLMGGPGRGGGRRWTQVLACRQGAILQERLSGKCSPAVPRKTWDLPGPELTGVSYTHLQRHQVREFLDSCHHGLWEFGGAQTWVLDSGLISL